MLPRDHLRDPAALTTWLAEAFAAAMRDLYLLNPDPGPDPARMYARFLGWVTPRLDIIRRREASGSPGRSLRQRAPIRNSTAPPADPDRP
ncbi:hypothetical protein GCM10022225_44190 [Plantactinospora mayteni]